METVEIDDFKVSIDPETNFWVIFDEVFPEEVIEFYSSRKSELIEKMRRYRFEVDFNTAYINPTERCNANCPYCYIPESIRKRGAEMDYEQLKAILEKLESLGIRNVVFHGAEPMIKRDLIFKAIEEFDFRFGIQTNGFLLQKEDVDFLIENRVNVGISLDSHDEKVNDFLRGKGHFKKVVSLIDYFSGYENLNIITTINRYNFTHLPEIIDFLAGKVRLVLMNPVRGTSNGGRELRPNPEESVRYFIQAVERAIWHTKNGRRIVIGDFANIMLGIVAPYSRVLQCDISPCGGGRRFFSVTPDGVYPCGEFIGFEEFRISHSEIENVENHFEMVRERKVERIDECRNCVYRNICGAPCPAEVYSEKGNMFEKPYYCEFYKKTIEHAFRVIRRGDTEYIVRLENLRKVYEIEV